MTSATHVPALQISGGQHWLLMAQDPHTPLLQAWPLQSLQVAQVLGGAHSGVDDGVRIAWS
jgi:hypothetical protein